MRERGNLAMQIKKSHPLYLLLLPLLFLSSVQADCTYKLFNLSSSRGTSIYEFVDQISDECGYTIIVTDKQAQKILRKRLNKTKLHDLIINEVLDIILKENNLSYTLNNNVLRISYITTKTYHLDYITSERTGTSKTNVLLSSTSGSGGVQTNQATTAEASSGESQTGLEISSTDTFGLWTNIKAEITEILNRPEDQFKVKAPTVNKDAGLITVSATYKQLQRLDTYVKALQEKLNNQVMIDVNLYSVTLSDTKSTGIDWAQIFDIQNLTVTQAHSLGSNAASASGSLVDLTGAITINDLVKFLEEQGDVRSVSNPKILTLNNQPALLSVGNQYFYKITQSSAQSSAGGSTIVENDIVDSVFAGILLDITPEISNDGTITLKINPSVSDIIGSVSSDSSTRVLPPDLSRKQLSAVVTAKDGQQVILGGLIGTTRSLNENKVPLLGDIPLLGYFFKSSRYENQTTELVIVITPHIVKKDKPLSIKELGYKGLKDKELKTGNFIKTFEKKD